MQEEENLEKKQKPEKKIKAAGRWYGSQSFGGGLNDKERGRGGKAARLPKEGKYHSR